MSEQRALQEVASSAGSAPSLSGNTEQQKRALAKLEAQGLVHRTGERWEIGSSLLAARVTAEGESSPGGLWLDEATDIVYRGEEPLDDLSPLEGALLRFFLQQPYARHTHTELIEAAWPEDTLRAGVTTEALYQVVRGVRRKVEPRPSQPRYIVNWRGTPEGGYRCFPEGKPR
jgi:DNA-binding response OmpR family regulator